MINRLLLGISMLFLVFVSCKENPKNKSTGATVSELNEAVGNSKLGNHPSLILTKKGVAEIRKNLGKLPLFDASLAEVKKEVDAEILLGIDVPIPKDYSGGYTHNRHKRNFLILQKAGALYQILEDEKYGKYVKDMLLQYEAIYKTLPVHPKTRSYARGKLFWQCLNDSNWLVYVSQAYDCIYDYLSEEERNNLETNLFRPFADFISTGNPQFYNRVHNHSTWGNAAVGMIGLVMNDEELIQRALYGIKNANLDPNAKDNDGGYINKNGKAGFLANIEEPFSPDGYYTEGPYYQRYAMYPFLIFAEGLQNVRPELNIFEYKEGVLLKSVNALLNLSDADGEFFPLNDGQKGMSYYSRELVTAVDIAYEHGNNDPGLLSIAIKQNQVLLDDSGFAIALGVKNGNEKPFNKKSINLSDGPEGKQGGVGILRNENLELVFKYAAHGSSHGHYDKLSFSLYENGEEVLQDYGLARFVNIEQKGGGNYLKENKTWAKQTIAHSTIVQNETSHFTGKYAIGSKHHSELFFFDDANENIQIVSAKENNAYPGTQLHRTLALIKDEAFSKPFALDLIKVTSDKKNQYDLPYYYFGQIMETNFDYKVESSLKPLGKKNGYQHLWKNASGEIKAGHLLFSWFHKNKFYAINSTSTGNDKAILATIGANDPEHNLRNDPGLIIRREQTQNTVFASVIESHGTYSPVSEFSVNPNSAVKSIQVVFENKEFTAVQIKTQQDKEKLFILNTISSDKTKKNTLSIEGKDYQWVGPYTYTNK
ncbi:alginate lyase family protein [Flavicella sediminum]|uniref:alginate lyase family protein n=1 Tax=Flavicella sediminum TaxID=2585141 RepID=UPI001122EEA6|nr:alginate lyase family protein [Flavicella sediminum]